MISLRDYHYFLHQTPMSDEEMENLNFDMIKENPEEAGVIFSNPFKQPLSDSEKQLIEEASLSIRNWKKFYMDCFKYEKYNLSGLWAGDYGNHGFELIKIFHKGYHVYAQKLTGDKNIPARKLTWRMTMDKSMKKGKGYFHLADEGFRDPRWNTGFIDTSEPNVLKIKWMTGVYGGHMCCVTFSNVKIGKAEFSAAMARKVEVFMVPQAEQLL